MQNFVIKNDGELLKEARSIVNNTKNIFTDTTREETIFINLLTTFIDDYESNKIPFTMLPHQKIMLHDLYRRFYSD